MRVHITYFKRSGKYYTDGSYETKLTNTWDIFAEIKAMNTSNTAFD